MSTSDPVLGVTMGDAGGIGPEIIAKAADEIDEQVNPVVLGDATVMEKAIELTGAETEVNRIEDAAEAGQRPDHLDIIDFGNIDEVVHGAVRADYGEAGLEYLEEAIDLALEGTIDGIVNAPLHKEAMNLAGSEHAGHTTLLTERSGTETYTTVARPRQVDFVIGHATMHLPLEEACNTIETELIADAVRLTDDSVRELGFEDPTIAVAGLNPHAGEGGVLGSTDADEIAPAVEMTQEEGLDVIGPHPPDSVFNQAMAGRFDAVITMYHDQGHIPGFLLGYQEGGGIDTAHMTVGLPFPRTSTLHGTAQDIAGNNIATPAAMVNAIETADQLSR